MRASAFLCFYYTSVLTFLSSVGPFLFRKQRGGEVTVAGVREEDDDGLALIFRTPGQLNCCVERRAGGNAHKHALFSAYQTTRFECRFIFDGDYLVVNFRVQNLGNKARAYALKVVCARLAARPEYAAEM